MKFCDAHWQTLRTAINDRGLSHLIAKDGQTAMESAVAELNGQQTDAQYDPLMSATYMIYGNAMRMGGLYLMTTDEHGNEYCPLCEVEKHVGEGTAQKWIDGCSDAILQHCQQRGLTSPTQ